MGAGPRAFWAAWVFLALPLGLCRQPARAQDSDSADFSLRFPAALSRFSTYADVAAVGGASAASKWSSSVNPASPAWRELASKWGLSLTPQYSLICFDEGAKLHVVPESLLWDSRKYGTFLATATQVRSNESTTRQGTDFRFDMDYYALQWGKKVSDDAALGAGFSFSRSRTGLDLGPADLAETTSESYGWRLGGLMRPADRWLAGLVLDYSFSPARTVMHDVFALGLGDQTSRDVTHQFLLRPGVSYEYAKDSAAYLDYQFGSFFNDTGCLDVHRFYAGVDHRIFDWLFVRGGAALDVEGRPAWTAGVGIYPTKWFSIDVAYQGNMFPELRPEFGRSQTLTLSVGVQF